jgi:hypothetical protein
MDFIGYKCPVCNENFHANDDVVVCPNCGTPHHRTCYEELGHCVNEEKHKDGFDFEAETQEEGVPEGAVKCSACGELNPKGVFYCQKCNAPLIEIPKNNYQGQQQGNPYGNAQNNNPYGNPNGGSPFGGNPMGGFNVVQMDPMAGVSPDAEFEQGAKAGEVAKYVKQNTPYFMQVFNRIKNFGKSRFSFAGLLFGGGYLLYRKQYVLGSIITAIMVACLIFTSYASIDVLNDVTQNVMNQISSSSNVTYTQIFNLYMEQVNSLDMGKYIIVMISSLCSVVYYGLHIVCGFIANRTYYKHCCKQVNLIKLNAKDDSDADNQLQTKGGVNTALAISLLAVAFIINFLPSFL